MATVKYLKRETTRRGITDGLGVPVAEAIAATQIIEQIVAVVTDSDPTLEDATFRVDVNNRAIEQGSYQLVNE